MILSTYYIVKSSHELILSKYYQIIHGATGNCQFCQVTRPSFTKQTALCSLCSWDDRRKLAPPNDHKKNIVCIPVLLSLLVWPFIHVLFPSRSDISKQQLLHFAQQFAMNIKFLARIMKSYPVQGSNKKVCVIEQTPCSMFSTSQVCRRYVRHILMFIHFGITVWLWL